MGKMKGTLEGKIEVVTLADLKIDERYQRDRKANAGRIEADWNPQAAGILTVAWRGDKESQRGDLYLVDGQQRWIAMRNLGIDKWKALVFHSSGVAHEAHVFKLLNDPKYRSGLSVRDLYKSLLVAQDPVALATKRAVELHGFYLAGGKREWPRVTALRACMRAVHLYGEECLARAFAIIKGAWEQQNEGLMDFFAEAIAALIFNNPKSFDDARMTAQLKKVPATKVVSEVVVTTRNRMKKAKEVLCEHYNTGIRRADYKIVPRADTLPKPEYLERSDDTGDLSRNGADASLPVEGQGKVARRE